MITCLRDRKTKHNPQTQNLLCSFVFSYFQDGRAIDQPLNKWVEKSKKWSNQGKTNEGTPVNKKLKSETSDKIAMVKWFAA